MTPSEISWLATGTNLGAILAMLTFIIGNALDCRRDRLAAEQALAQVRKVEATIGWRQTLTSRSHS